MKTTSKVYLRDVWRALIVSAAAWSVSWVIATIVIGLQSQH